jgi:predicted nucleic acid-binding protein
MINDPVFLDTSGWIALLNRREDLHAEANRIWRRLGRERRTVFATDWVVAETGNGLSSGFRRDLFARSLRVFLGSSNVRVIYVDANLLDQSLALFESRSDKDWGLVDCASFVVMTEHGIREAFTCDHHFDQAGFSRLLRSS